MREINEISIHCSATPSSWYSDKLLADKIKEIRRWHVEERGWQDIGYHYLIDRDGTIGTGRPVDKIPAAVKGHNSHIIAVCLIGGHTSEADDNFSENFTKQQDSSLRKVIADLKAKFPMITSVTGHNKYAAKACPGFRVDEWYYGKPAKNKSENLSGSTTIRAAIATLVANGAVISAVTASFEHLHDGVQYALIGLCGVIMVTMLIILRSRIRHWARGVR